MYKLTISIPVCGGDVREGSLNANPVTGMLSVQDIRFLCSVLLDSPNNLDQRQDS
jgi:hypothetical protein